MFIKRALKVFVIAIVVFAFASVAYAYAAANTVGDSQGGDGSGDISGYTADNITYTLDPSDPADITGVEFTLDAIAATVYASLDSGALVACTSSDGIIWSCPVTGTAASAASLRVIAAQ